MTGRYVFEHNNDWYMMPQHDNGPLELYKNVEWPGKWAKVVRLRQSTKGMGDASIVCWQVLYLCTCLSL